MSWKTIAWKIPNPTAVPPTTLFGWKAYTSSTVYTDFLNDTKDPVIDALITGFANDPAYLAIVNQPVGYSAVDLPRLDGGNSDNMMGTFIDDAIYNYLNTDGTTANNIDIFFNNAGGIHADWCYVGGVSTTRDAWLVYMTLPY